MSGVGERLHWSLRHDQRTANSIRSTSFWPSKSYIFVTNLLRSESCAHYFPLEIFLKAGHDDGGLLRPARDTYTFGKRSLPARPPSWHSFVSHFAFINFGLVLGFFRHSKIQKETHIFLCASMTAEILRVSTQHAPLPGYFDLPFGLPNNRIKESLGLSLHDSKLSISTEGFTSQDARAEQIHLFDVFRIGYVVPPHIRWSAICNLGSVCAFRG